MKKRIIFRPSGLVYTLDGREVSRQEFEQECPSRDGYCTNFQGSTLQDWGTENGGKGRYISQLADEAHDKRAYARSPKEAMEKAKKRGFKAERVS